jgi:hypothetical protein
MIKINEVYRSLRPKLLVFPYSEPSNGVSYSDKT